MEEFTLSQVAEIARSPKRAVQLWADAGVIKADSATMRAGSGVHRRFKRREVLVACVVSPFAKQRVAIGGLEVISLVVRHLTQDHVKVFERAADQKGRNYLLVYWTESKAGELRTCTMDVRADDRGQSVNFFDAMRDFPGPHEQPVIKVDVINLNEALKSMPTSE